MMTNLVKMDLYRMVRARSFKVCLVLAFLSGFCQVPLAKLFLMLLRFLPDSMEIPDLLPKNVTLSSIFENPFPVLNCMLILFSVCYFFYADLEHGYIKNIAGQLPRRGYTIVSRFLALIFHNLVFITAGVLGNIIGTLPFIRITLDAGALKTLGYLGIRFLLLQGICAILLFVTCSLRSKNFGMVLSVVFGAQMMELVYVGIDAGLGLIFKKEILIEGYMPDQLMDQTAPKVMTSLPVAAVTIAVFLFLAIWLFEKRDVK